MAPTISSVTATPVNDNSVLSGWGVYAYGKSKAQIKINGAAGAYGSTIKSYSITTSHNVGHAHQQENEHLAADALKAHRAGELFVRNGTHDSGHIVEHHKDHQRDHQAIQPAEKIS